jgi:gluconokinase
MIQTQSSNSSVHIIIIMGVAGSGKTTLGQHLITCLQSGSADAVFLDADTFHPQSNIEKMSKGIPLSDEDRIPWLKSILDAVYAKQIEWSQQSGQRNALNRYIVAACSSLKKRYRDVLRDPNYHNSTYLLRFVFLDVGKEALLRRLEGRDSHFFKGSAMLESQLNTLETPDLNIEKDVITIHHAEDKNLDELAALVMAGLR